MSFEWREITLADIADVNPKRIITKGSTASFVDMAALSTATRDIGGHIEPRTFKGSGSKFQNGDTLLARITPCLENGKTALVNCLLDGEVAHGSTEFIVLGPKRWEDRLFLYYLARSNDFRTYAISRMEGTSGRQRVPTSAVAQYVFSCPPADERAEIGKFLGALDDRITLLRETDAILEAIAQAIFKSWFVDFDPVRAKMEGRQPDGMDEETAALFPDSFEESELGLMPTGWLVKSLDEVANYLNGLALQKFPPTGTNDIPIIKIAQLRKGDTSGADLASGNIKSEYIIHDGDVLFSWSGSLEAEVWCGGTGALNQHLFKVTSVRYPKWFYYLWTKHHLPSFRQIAAGKATTMGHIQRKHLSAAMATIPSTDIMKEADKVFAPLMDLQIENALQVRSLSAIRDALLPRLISGQLSVSDSGNRIAEAWTAA